jgi:tRNA(fMet)-specific endonuclease VapC
LLAVPGLFLPFSVLSLLSFSCYVANSGADIEPAAWDIAVGIYIDLKQKGQLIDDADILIAAYCMSKNYTLVTRNERDFKRIANLKFVNWFE